MPIYNVHAYETWRTKYTGVEAESMEDAVHLIENDAGGPACENEFADETQGYLVDLMDDAGELVESKYFDLLARTKATPEELALAREQHGDFDSCVEIDDDALTSKSDEPDAGGFYIQGWVWVDTTNNETEEE